MRNNYFFKIKIKEGGRRLLLGFRNGKMTCEQQGCENQPKCAHLKYSINNKEIVSLFESRDCKISEQQIQEVNS